MSRIADMGLPALKAFWISFRATHSWLKNPPPELEATLR
jgi:hypothetical protein